MSYKGEIRHSQINQLLEKVSGKNYGKYLVSVRIAKARAFEDQRVTFDFPVTAIIGPNGGGKTTVLGAAGCAYLDIKPQRFFARNGTLDDTMQNWKLYYELIDRSISQRDSLHRAASFHSQKWYRDALKRNVVIFGVSRTVPAVERVELKKFASNSATIAPEQYEAITNNVLQAVRKVLGKNVDGYRNVKIDNRGRISLLAGRTKDNSQYSEFHFGAGESSIFRMVMQIELLPDNSLILIEEIENGLHPVATIRMVEYLIEVAERKSAQVIFTTHSNEALKPLPSQAIWVTIDGKVFQGKLDIESLRAITNDIDAQLVIFTEDQFSKDWVQAVLRACEIPGDIIETHFMAGDGTAAKVNQYHNMDPSSQFPSVCIVDGDSRQETSAEKQVYRLPGECPEAYIYDAIIEKLNEVSGQLTVALHQPYNKHEQVSSIIREIRDTNRDPHLLYSQVGERLGFLPEQIVRSAFLSVWAHAYMDEARQIVEPVITLLPDPKTSLGETSATMINMASK